MRTAPLYTSSCRYCRYYRTEGRRGGMCQQLGGPVKANWKACSVAEPAFTSSWENLGDIVHLEHSFSKSYPDHSAPIPLLKPAAATVNLPTESVSA